MLSAELPVDAAEEAASRELALERWSIRSGTNYCLGSNKYETETFPEVLDLRDQRFSPGIWWVTPEECAITVEESVTLDGEHYIRDDFQVREKVRLLNRYPGGKVYEVTDVESWSQFVDRYGDYTPITTYDWGLQTERLPVIPNWKQVSRDWDAVYVSLNGYMNVTYSPIMLDEENWTVLSGWHPGSTVWLNRL